jgi:hypothetical protein
MKYRFQKGDLVKNKKSVVGSDGRRAMRDQKAMGIIMEDVGIFSGRQIVKVKWLMSMLPEGKSSLWQTHYVRNLELVASVSK